MGALRYFTKNLSMEQFRMTAKKASSPYPNLVEALLIKINSEFM